jgi:hypothetical protein
VRHNGQAETVWKCSRRHGLLRTHGRRKRLAGSHNVVLPALAEKTIK